jgi:serine/threonine protein kinase
VPPASREEFLREEAPVHTALAQAPHQHVLSVREVVQLPETPLAADVASAYAVSRAVEPVPRQARGGIVLVQPKLDVDLHTYIRQRGRLPLAEARALFAQLVAAVAHCHRLGIVLRDLKLGKIFFADARRETIVLAALEGAQLVPTLEDSVLLTDHRAASAYVSPESLDNTPHDPAAVDMWALGVILHVLLTGSYPFQDKL